MEKSAVVKEDPYSKPAMSLLNRLARSLWGFFYITLFRPSPRPFHVWRSMLLRLFGAKLGSGCHIYPKSKIWAPWNLICEDVVAIADGAIIYNPDTITIMSHATISQDAYLCGASHDYDDPAFSMISRPITIEAYAWICARSSVLPGVTIKEGAVLALGSVTSKDLEPWSVYAGMPAKKIKDRKQHELK
ncbi:MAG: putative colanic acid biosynthesis acetyltransferase [Gammaproteobacteria bacterium]|nr:putative colanic acid biosynthesis acetyltransferase [Gammaproteobacteria bacterium]